MSSILIIIIFINKHGRKLACDGYIYDSFMDVYLSTNSTHYIHSICADLCMSKVRKKGRVLFICPRLHCIWTRKCSESQILCWVVKWKDAKVSIWDKDKDVFSHIVHQMWLSHNPVQERDGILLLSAFLRFLTHSSFKVLMYIFLSSLNFY